MGLSGYKVRTSIAVSDIARAAELNEGRLDLSAGEVQPGESLIHACGGDTSLHVYASPVHAGTSTATLATWYVDDLEELVDELRSAGVMFERCADPSLSADETGIHELADGRSPWLKDPDGNTFALEQ